MINSAASVAVMLHERNMILLSNREEYGWELAVAENGWLIF